VRAYRVTGPEGTTPRYGGSMAEAVVHRQAFVDNNAVMKKTVAIEEVEIPTDKRGLITFLNAL